MFVKSNKIHTNQAHRRNRRKKKALEEGKSSCWECNTPAGKVVSRSECVFLSGRFWCGVSVTGSSEWGCWGKGSPREGDGDGECWRRSTPWNLTPPLSPAGGRQEQGGQQNQMEFSRTWCQFSETIDIIKLWMWM